MTNAMKSFERIPKLLASCFSYASVFLVMLLAGCSHKSSHLRDFISPISESQHRELIDKFGFKKDPETELWEFGSIDGVPLLNTKILYRDSIVSSITTSSLSQDLEESRRYATILYDALIDILGNADSVHSIEVDGTIWTRSDWTRITSGISSETTFATRGKSLHLFVRHKRLP